MLFYAKAYMYHSKVYVTLYANSNLQCYKEEFFSFIFFPHIGRDAQNRQNGRICSRLAATTPDAHAFMRTYIEGALSPLTCFVNTRHAYVRRSALY